VLSSALEQNPVNLEAVEAPLLLRNTNTYP